MIKCEIRQRKCRNILSLSCHIREKHKYISKEQYYDKYILLDINESICPICKNKAKFMNMSEGYRKTCCSKKCNAVLHIVTSNEKYGVDNVFQSNDIKIKSKETMKHKYGSEHALQIEEFVTKVKNTNKKLYGFEFASQSPEKQIKSKESKLKNHNDENYNNRSKAKETCLEIYGTENPMQNEEIKTKSKATCMKKYGTENPMQNEEIKTKSKATCMRLYNAENPFQVEDFKEKSKATCMKKYGTENPMQNEEIKTKSKTTCLRLYNVENPFQVEDFKEKSKATCMKKYGVEHQSQCVEIHEKQQKYTWKDYVLPSGKIIKIQGYENMFLDEYFREGNKEETIIYQRKLMPKIWYINSEDGKKHRYYPDFYIPKENKIIEVKSTWTMKKYLIKNLLKEKACIDNRFSFEFKIYDKNGKLQIY